MHRFPTKILLATDGSEDAALALHAAVDLSTKTESELHVVHAWQTFSPNSHPAVAGPTDVDSYEREAREFLFGQLDEVQARGGSVAGTHLERGQPAEVISDLTGELGIGLVVMGSRGPRY